MELKQNFHYNRFFIRVLFCTRIKADTNFTRIKMNKTHSFLSYGWLWAFCWSFVWICPISPSNCFLYFWFVKNMSFLVLSVNLCISQKFFGYCKLYRDYRQPFFNSIFPFSLSFSYCGSLYTDDTTFAYDSAVRCLAFSVPSFARYALHRIHIMKTVGVHSAYRNV